MQIDTCIHACIYKLIFIYKYVYVNSCRCTYTFAHIFTQAVEANPRGTRIYINLHMKWDLIYQSIYIVSFMYVVTVCVRGTGWRRLIGSPTLQITFHKRATK